MMIEDDIAVNPLYGLKFLKNDPVMEPLPRRIRKKLYKFGKNPDRVVPPHRRNLRNKYAAEKLHADAPIRRMGVRAANFGLFTRKLKQKHFHEERGYIVFNSTTISKLTTSNEETTQLLREGIRALNKMFDKAGSDYFVIHSPKIVPFMQLCLSELLKLKPTTFVLPLNEEHISVLRNPEFLNQFPNLLESTNRLRLKTIYDRSEKGNKSNLEAIQKLLERVYQHGTKEFEFVSYFDTRDYKPPRLDRYVFRVTIKGRRKEGSLPEMLFDMLPYQPSFLTFKYFGMLHATWDLTNSASYYTNSRYAKETDHHPLTRLRYFASWLKNIHFVNVKIEINLIDHKMYHFKALKVYLLKPTEVSRIKFIFNFITTMGNVCFLDEKHSTLLHAALLTNSSIIAHGFNVVINPRHWNSFIARSEHRYAADTLFAYRESNLLQYWLTVGVIDAPLN